MLLEARTKGVAMALFECLSDDFDVKHSTFHLETVDRCRVEDRPHA